MMSGLCKTSCLNCFCYSLNEIVGSDPYLLGVINLDTSPRIWNKKIIRDVWFFLGYDPLQWRRYCFSIPPSKGHHFLAFNIMQLLRNPYLLYMLP